MYLCIVQLGNQATFSFWTNELTYLFASLAFKLLSAPLSARRLTNTVDFSSRFNENEIDINEFRYRNRDLIDI